MEQIKMLVGEEKILEALSIFGSIYMNTVIENRKAGKTWEYSLEAADYAVKAEDVKYPDQPACQRASWNISASHAIDGKIVREDVEIRYKEAWGCPAGRYRFFICCETCVFIHPINSKVYSKIYAL